MTNLSLPEPGNYALSAPASNPSAAPATLSDSENDDAKRELEWKTSLRNLEHHMDTYKSRAKGGGDLEQEAEEVAKAMENVAASHPDPKVKTHWHDKARTFRAASSEEREGILEEIGKGFLMLLTMPFMVVGAAFQAAGGILTGVGSILRGLGRLAGKLSYTGSSSKKKDAEEESTYRK